jgi:hypothetical protein
MPRDESLPTRQKCYYFERVECLSASSSGPRGQECRINPTLRRFLASVLLLIPLSARHNSNGKPRRRDPLAPTFRASPGTRESRTVPKAKAALGAFGRFAHKPTSAVPRDASSNMRQMVFDLPFWDCKIMCEIASRIETAREGANHQLPEG